MRRTLSLIVVVLLLSLCAMTAFALEGHEGKSQLFIMHEYKVKPSMVHKYEAAAKEFMAALGKHGMDVPFVRASMMDDFTYHYMIPVESIGDADNIHKAFGAWIDKFGEENWQALEEKFAGTVDHEKISFVRSVADHSYHPENSMMKPEDIGFIDLSFYYIMGGKEKEAMGLAKEYVELFKSKNIPTGYDLYWGDIGTEMPLIVVVQLAKSAADFHTQDAKVEAMLGEEGKALGAKVLAITRRIEHKSAWPRPDLSYYPPKEDMTAK